MAISKSMSSTPRWGADAGLGAGTCAVAVSSTQASTDRLIEDHLQRRFGLSPELARVVADLMDQHAGLLEEETRCG
jgi:hypothetical protein